MFKKERKKENSATAKWKHTLSLDHQNVTVGEKYIAMIDYPAYIPQYLKKQSYLVNFPVFIVDY